jgi:3-oxoacyl-[acyl-carrier protein] reductase
LARYNIRSNAIAPGFISTEMTAGMRPATLETICSGIPASRMGTPEEIAHAAIFLLENEYMSGRIVEVDGALRI